MSQVLKGMILLYLINTSYTADRQIRQGNWIQFFFQSKYFLVSRFYRDANKTVFVVVKTHSTIIVY